MYKKVLHFIILFSVIFVGVGFFSSSALLADGPLLEGSATLTPESCKLKKVNDKMEPACGTSDACKKYCGSYEVNDFMKTLVKASDLMLGIVGSLALAAFFYGGILFMVSAGNSETVSKGKNVMIGAVIGLIIVFTSYLVIDFTMEAMKGENKQQGWNTTPPAN